MFIFSEHCVSFVYTVCKLKKFFDTSDTSLYIDSQNVVLLVLNLYYITCKKWNTTDIYIIFI